MADELGLRSIDGENPSPDFVGSLRARVLAEAATLGETDRVVDLEVLADDDEESTMRSSRWLTVGGAAATVALVVGLLVVTGDDGGAPSPVDAPTATTAPPTTNAPVVTSPVITVPPGVEPESAGRPGADADAGCGLDESAALSAVVDDLAESVTIVVSSDPSCSGVEARVVATPWSQGFAIDRAVTLDDEGAASVTDHLLSTRQANQDWTAELVVDDTDGVAATHVFDVTGVCDLDLAQLEASFDPATDEVHIVLTVDPACVGSTFTFDDREMFASSPPGGWATYSVDEAGRIEVTEQLVPNSPFGDGSFIDVFAFPVPAERGFITGHVARVALDVSG